MYITTREQMWSQGLLHVSTASKCLRSTTSVHWTATASPRPWSTTSPHARSPTTLYAWGPGPSRSRWSAALFPTAPGALRSSWASSWEGLLLTGSTWAMSAGGCLSCWPSEGLGFGLLSIFCLSNWGSLALLMGRVMHHTTTLRLLKFEEIKIN